MFHTDGTALGVDGMKCQKSMNEPELSLGELLNGSKLLITPGSLAGVRSPAVLTVITLTHH